MPMKRRCDVSQTIIDGMNAAHLNVDELSDRTGIPKSTIYDRLRAPWSLKLGELKAIDRAVKFTDWQISGIIRGDM